MPNLGNTCGIAKTDIIYQFIARAKNKMLQRIKLLHTVIRAFFVALIIYIAYVGITGAITKWVWIAIALVAAESIVILLNGRACPLTAVAAKYTDERKDNFDICLPLWLARYNKLIFSILFIAGLLLMLARLFIGE